MKNTTLALSCLIFLFIGCKKTDTLEDLINQYNGNEEALNIPKDSWIRQYGSVSAAARNGSATGYELCYGSVVDHEGNSYCGGYTSGAMVGSSGGNYDAFITKINPQGQIEWMKQIGANQAIPGSSAAGLDVIQGLTTDFKGHIYFTGYTRSSLGEANVNGNNDLFIGKMNASDGSLVWLKQLGSVTIASSKSSGHENGFAVAVDSSNGFVYVAGETSAAMVEANSGWDMIFAKFKDADGSLVWLKQYGSVTATALTGLAPAGRENCNDIALSKDGTRLYCAGSTSGALGEASGGGTDAFLMSITSSGTFEWVKQFGNTTKGPGGNTSLADLWHTITLDSSDNIYLAGVTAGSIGEASGGSDDLLFAKYSKTGNLIWLKQFGSVTKPLGMDTSGSEYCYMGFNKKQTALHCVGSSTGAFGETNGGSYDIFSMKMDVDANPVWITHLGASTVFPGGSSASADYAGNRSHHVVDAAGNSFIIGGTGSSLGEAFGGGTYDAAIIKIKPDGGI